MLVRNFVVLGVVITSMSSLAAMAAEPLRFTCVDMAAAIGEPATILELAPNDGWEKGPDEARLVCTWFTKPAEKVLQDEQITRPEYQDIGNLTAQVVVYDQPLEQSSAASMNVAFEVPVANVPSGAWLFALKKPNFDAPIAISTPQILYKNVGVNVAAGSAFTQTAQSWSQLSVGWSVDASVRILNRLKLD